MEVIVNMDVYVCSTLYHVYLSLIMNFNKKKQSIIILSSHDKEMQKIFEIIVKKNNNTLTTFILRNRSRFLDNLFIERIYDKNFIKKLELKNSDSIFLFGWNKYYLYRTCYPFYKNFNNLYLIEESAISYLIPKPSFFKRIVLELFGLNDSFMNSDKVKKIFVQSPEKYSKVLEEKIEKIDYKNFISNISQDQKEKLVSILLNNDDYEKITKIKNVNSVLILTQPLSEDGYETEINKIKIYEMIINEQLSSNAKRKIYLKPHPRDTTNYKFEKVETIGKNFPSEIFELLNIRFDLVIGVCTSAINQINALNHVNIKPNYFDKK